MGNPMTNCKAAVMQLINSADDDDLLTLVTYSSHAEVVFEALRFGDAGARQKMQEKIDEITCDGGTNLHGGLLAGYEALVRVGAPNKHMFLLSDGQANQGVSDTPSIIKSVEGWTEKIPILSYGIGNGFNEKLMSPLGQIHRGSHYFYIEDAQSIERMMARGIKALTGAVARNVHLEVTPLTAGLTFPDNMVDGLHFPLVRSESVMQCLIDLEVSPQVQVQTPSTDAAEDGFELVGNKAKQPQQQPQQQQLSFKWRVTNFPLLTQREGVMSFTVTSDRDFRKSPSPQVETYMQVKRGLELRSKNTRDANEQALKVFNARLNHDEFGFAQQHAINTQTLLDDARAWEGNTASSSGAKSLGVHYAACAVEEEEEEECDEMDFGLFD